MIVEAKCYTCGKHLAMRAEGVWAVDEKNWHHTKLGDPRARCETSEVHILTAPGESSVPPR